MLIVLYHIYGYTGRAANSIIYSFCHTVQLPLFFYISGMLLFRKSTQTINLYDKTIRLLVPFCVFYSIWIIIHLNNLSHDEFKGGYWFLLVLFEMMFIIAISLIISKRFNIDIRIVQIVIYLFLSIYEFSYPKNTAINIVLSTNLLWHYFPFFIMGIYHNNIKLIYKLKYIIIYAIIFVFALYLYYVNNYIKITPLCNLFSLLFFVTLFKSDIRPFERIISLFGVYSMQIYLLHFWLVELIHNYIPLVNQRMIEFLIFLILSIVLILLIIGISNYLMKSKWCRLLLFGIK